MNGVQTLEAMCGESRWHRVSCILRDALSSMITICVLHVTSLSDMYIRYLMPVVPMGKLPFRSRQLVGRWSMIDSLTDGGTDEQEGVYEFSPRL